MLSTGEGERERVCVKGAKDFPWKGNTLSSIHANHSPSPSKEGLGVQGSAGEFPQGVGLAGAVGVVYLILFNILRGMEGGWQIGSGDSPASTGEIGNNPGAPSSLHASLLRG